jgi:hypothetical protein
MGVEGVCDESFISSLFSHRLRVVGELERLLEGGYVVEETWPERLTGVT